MGFNPTISGLDSVPTNCANDQTGISVHTSRFKFTVTIVVYRVEQFMNCPIHYVRCVLKMMIHIQYLFKHYMQALITFINLALILQKVQVHLQKERLLFTLQIDHPCKN
jgi:hypothetical protein